MFHSIEKEVSGAFHAHILIRYGVDLTVAVEQPRQSEFGEMAVPAAFQLAKQLRQAPRKIAAEMVAEMGALQGVAAMEIAGKICIFTNDNFTVEELSSLPEKAGATPAR